MAQSDGLHVRRQIITLQAILSMAILAKQGVTPEMVFKCVDCKDAITGQAVLDGEYLYIVKRNKENPADSTFRCECCQDDVDDRD